MEYALYFISIIFVVVGLIEERLIPLFIAGLFIYIGVSVRDMKKQIEALKKANNNIKDIIHDQIQNEITNGLLQDFITVKDVDGVLKKVNKKNNQFDAEIFKLKNRVKWLEDITRSNFNNILELKTTE